MSENKTIIFGGDIYLDDSAYKYSSELQSLCQDADFVLFNLEAPVFTNSVDIPEKYNKVGATLFQREKKVRELFDVLNVKYVGGANNHIFDYGEKGIVSTKKVLDSLSVSYSGFGINLEEAKRPMKLSGSSISIISTCEEEFAVANKDTFGCFSMYSHDVLEQIEQSKRAGDFVVVFAHGGGEYIPLPSKYIRNRYRDFIDNGADLVVGHHPHVPQGWEEYKEKHIFYSLGNFIHAKYPKKLGVLLKVVIDSHARRIISFDIIPILLDNGTVSLKDFDNELKGYFKKINELNNDEKNFEAVYQDQALSMYYAYYRKYFEDVIFDWKRRIKRFVVTKKRREAYDMFERLFLMHLMRNNSHREFITSALKLLTNDMKDARTEESSSLFQELDAYIRKV